MKNKITIPKSLINKIKREKDKIAAARDVLRELYDDLANFVGTTDQATEALDDCIELLSQEV